MDQGNGTFRQVSDIELEMIDEKLVSRIFSVGEELKIKDSRFRVKAIGRREMRLRLLED